MEDKDTKAHQRNEAEKEDETQDKQSNNQGETEQNEIENCSEDSTSLAPSTYTEKNASSEDNTTQTECELGRPTEEPCFNPEDQSVSKVPEGNPVPMDKDRSDGHNTETQQEGPPINMHCGDYSKGPSGSEETQVILNEKPEDMPTKSTMEEATKTPVEDSTSLAASTYTEKNASSEDNTTQSECELGRPTEEPCLNPEDQSISKVPEGNPVSMDKDRSDGHNTETQQEGPPINMHCGDYSKGPSGSEETQVILNEESEDMPTKSTMEEATKTPVEDNEGTLEPVPEKPEAQTALLQEMPTEEKTLPQKDIQTIGSIPQEEVESNPEVLSSVKEDKRKYWLAIALVVVVAVISQLFQPESPPQKKDVSQIDIFRQELEKLKVQFPSQREELWKRSKIHLQRHFQISNPTEPISLILTAGVRAEGTLCSLARSIASALSSALNASVLHIEGASKASQDSDEVKSDIDSQLQKAFEGDKPIAVIHHFEDLPPASTLIFYRYCDHENAAFKKTFLIFTILLGDEEEIPATIRLNAVEEMVNDHLQKKFLSHGHPTAFDKMDIDKYSGLWSRISHLILPVATEERIKKMDNANY